MIAVFRMQARGRGSGVVLHRQDAIVSRLRDGVVVRQDRYNNRAEALESVALG